MKKIFALTILFLYIPLLKAGPIQDLENAIKEGDRIKVIELSRNMTLSQQEIDRLEQYAHSILNSQKPNRSQINMAFAGIAAGATATTIGSFFSGAFVKCAYEEYKKYNYDKAIKTSLCVQPPCLVVITGGVALFIQSIRSTLHYNKNNDEHNKNTAEIIAIIKSIKNDQTDSGSRQ